MQTPIKLSLFRIIGMLFCWFAIVPLQAQQKNDIREQISKVLQTYHQLGLFNGNALIAYKDSIIFESSYGFADVHAKKKLSADTRFNMYSIAKPVTATVVLRLVEENKLALSDRLSRFFPAFPFADSICVEHLLTHTAGIFAYNNDFSMPVSSEEAMINWLSKKPLDFAPGSQFRYSNTGYYLLGFIIEKITGLTYEKAVQQYILSPLEMNKSGSDIYSLPTDQRATGYLYASKRTAEAAPVWDYRELYAAGGLYTTTRDLLRFQQALRKGHLLQPVTLQKALTPFKRNYGYGWFIDSLEGHRVVSHSGGATGFRSYLVWDHTSDYCIILLCNTETSDIVAIRNKLLDAINGRPSRLPLLQAPPISVLNAYQGAYQLTPSMTVYIHREKGQLMATPNRKGSSILLPTGPGSFSIEAKNAELRFVATPQGHYDTLYFSQEGQSVAAPRLAAGWGITGSATPTGWEGQDIALQQKGSKWIATNVQLKDGVIKFRYHNNWTLNYGINQQTKRLKKDGGDIPVKAGLYVITLDLKDPDKPKLVLQKE